jgi:hypothetical protein
MHKSTKTILGFAFLGLAIAAGACYLYAAFYDYSKPMNGADATIGIISVILCPPQLLFGFCIDCEVIGFGGVIMYSIIGILNAALYALIGFMVLKLRKGAASRTSEQEPPIGS